MDQPGGGLDGDVRQDPEADDHPGHDPQRDQRAGRVELVEQAIAGRRQDESDGPAEQGAKDTDVSDQRLPRGVGTLPASRAVINEGSA